MKIFKFGLRIWIAVVSVVSFLLGWVLFAHSNKPAPLIQQASQPAQVAPSNLNSGLPSISSFGNIQSGTSSLPSFSQTNTFRPRLRTGGS